MDDPGSGTSPAPSLPAMLADYVGFLLRRAHVRATQAAESALPEDTHPRDHAILRALAAGGVGSQRELADQLHINRTIMVKLVDRLEARGWVRRQRNPADRRTHTLVVTPRGQEAAELMTPTVADAAAAFTAPLRPTEVRCLNDLLGRLVPVRAELLPKPAAERAACLIAHAHHRFRHDTDVALARLGILARDFGALATLATMEPCSQQAAARALAVTEPQMVTIVDQLSEAGLVERHRDTTDRRRYALRLTPEGHRTLRSAHAEVAAAQAAVTGDLSADDIAQLRRLLRSLIQGGAG